MAIMFPVFLSGGVVMTIYFIWQLTKKKAWAKFKTPHFPLNFVLIFIMAIISGIVTKEWVEASAKAKRFLYTGLTCMVLGIVIIALDNKLNKPEPKTEAVVMVEQKEARL